MKERVELLNPVIFHVPIHLSKKKNELFDVDRQFQSSHTRRKIWRSLEYGIHNW